MDNNLGNTETLTPVNSVEQTQPLDNEVVVPAEYAEVDFGDQGLKTYNSEFTPGFISWTAAEYAETVKSQRWFVILAVGAAVLAGLALFWLRDIVLSIMIVAMTVTLVIITKRPPREMSYSLSYANFTVNQKVFPISSFRSFGLVQEGAVWNIRLFSNKRFIPPVTAYIPNEQGEQIIDTLGALLPMEDIEPDFVDKLVAKSKI